jgi:hypothetical protein
MAFTLRAAAFGGTGVEAGSRRESSEQDEECGREPYSHREGVRNDPNRPS